MKEMRVKEIKEKRAPGRRLLCSLFPLSFFLGAGSPAPGEASPWPGRADQYRELFGSEFRRSTLKPEYRPYLASQIEVESAWRARARSRYAAGLTQFTPDTEEWITSKYLRELGKLGGSLDPRWAIRAQMLYMKELVLLFHRRGSPGVEDKFGLASRSYNGGRGYIDREQRAARASGEDPNSYASLPEFCHRFRQDWACEENLAYFPRIRQYLKKYRHF